MVSSSIAPNKEVYQQFSLSVVVIGSGGAGSITTGNLLLEACARAGCFGIMTRSVGPQIRGGEAAAMLRLSADPVTCISDRYDILLAMDWNNVDRFAGEIPLDADSIIIADPGAGEIPEIITASNAGVVKLPIGDLAKEVKKGRPNMIALGILAEMMDLPRDAVTVAVAKQLGGKGEQVLQSSLAAIDTGRNACSGLARRPAPHNNSNGSEHWIISGNEALGLGAVRGGIRFVAAYPITPATDVLEWMASGLARVGGTLVQAEDELASINMIIGAAYGGVPSLTATSGPGLSLMIEGLGLAVGSEIPIVVVDVMRVGPSTGIATKPEQSDLNIAVYGFHGDAPHVVLAPTSINDCLFTAQWGVYLAEAMQVPALILSDQYLGQAHEIISPPATVSYRAQREIALQPDAGFRRYAVTESGISPMSIPGTPGGEYTADGLEHSPKGTPSTSSEDHAVQMEKRARKVTGFDYGDHWADVEGEGDIAVITWGSTTGAVREALKRLGHQGIENIKIISIRLLLPVQSEQFSAAMEGVNNVLIVEQSHSAQFHHYLRAHYDLPARVEVLHRAGPLVLRPAEIVEKIKSWSTS